MLCGVSNKQKHSYDAVTWGNSGNITVNGTLTFSNTTATILAKRGKGAGGQKGVNLNQPPYAIHNGAYGLP